MLNPVTFEDVEFSIVFSKGDGDLKLTMGIFEELPPFAGDAKPVAGLVEIEIDRLKGIGIFRNAVFQIFKRERVAESEQGLL